MPQSQPDRNHLPAIMTAGSALLVALLLGVTGASADEPASDPTPACVESGCGNNCQNALATTRRSTAKYLDEARAVRDGFIADPFCIAIPGVGAMGFHYVNPEWVADIAVNPLRPEVLLYAERPNGKRHLVALEYLVPVLSGGMPWQGSASEPPPTIDNPPPVLFRRTFDGPMPGHTPTMPWHYELHVWAWQHNPAGTFAPFNPRLSCP